MPLQEAAKDKMDKLRRVLGGQEEDEESGIMTQVQSRCCHVTIVYYMKKDSKRCCDITTPKSIHTKDESKRGSAFAFIFGVN